MGLKVAPKAGTDVHTTQDEIGTARSRSDINIERKHSFLIDAEKLPKSKNTLSVLLDSRKNSDMNPFAVIGV